jgi:hypothetical protein
MNLNPGSPRSNYSGSMAEAIEKAFFEEWKTYMGAESTPPLPNDQMKHLCVAISRGVIKHLVDNPDAFNITVDVGGISYPATVIINPEL